VTTILVAVAAGLAAGYARGGRLSQARHARIRSWWLLLAGIAVQTLVPRPGWQLLAFVLLAAFAARNFTRQGMGVLLIGIVLNAAPIALDGGMPVEAHAIVSAHIATTSEIGNLSFGGRRHLAHAGDHLRALDDTIPEWWTHEVLSFGDIVIAIGVAAVIAGLLRQPIDSNQSSNAAASGP
jgi:hypothetical protein